MAYFSPYVDDSGIHIPTYVDIRDDLVQQFKSIYGEDIYLDNDSQDYQMISAFAIKTYDCMQLLQIAYNNHSPKTAVGTGLSSVVKLNGIARKAASYSTCVLTIEGRVGTVIPNGVVKDDKGILWDLPENTTITSSPMEITAICETIGAIEAIPGSIHIINNPQAGWTSVTNNVHAVTGQPVEKDVDLRLRQSISVALPSRNMLDGTRAAIAAIDGVSRYYVYDNDTNLTDENGIPGHSIAAVVEGGLDADIAEAIYLHKGPGGGTYGSTTYPHVNQDGITTNIRYSRPTYTLVDIDVGVRTGTGYTEDILETIYQNLDGYIDGLSIGNDVTMTGVLNAISKAVSTPSTPEFLLASVKIGLTGEPLGFVDIPISWNAVADIGSVSVREVTT